MSSRHYGAVARGPLVGLLIGLLVTGTGLAAGELVVGLVSGSASAVVPVGQVVIDHVPPSVKSWAIDQFGTADKAVLVVGTLLVLSVVGAVVGSLAVRGRRIEAAIVTTAVGLVGAAAVLARPAPTLAKTLPAIVGTLASIAALWVLTGGWRRAVSSRPADVADVADVDVVDVPVVSMVGVDRRGLLQSAVAVGSLAAIAGGLGRVLQRRYDISDERAALALPSADDAVAGLPADVELAVPGITPFVVPNDGFYRIDTAIVVPQVERSSWKLKLHGMVDRELTFAFDDLLARPQIERYITLSCVSNEVGGDLVGNALWQGVRLADLLDEAGVQDGAEQLVSRSVDGWTCGSPLAAVLDGRDAMLALAMNGEPLPARHGYPVRIVVPGLYGYVSATKWVTEIMLTRWDDFDAYWVPRGWSKQPPEIKTTARIDTPRRKADTGTVMVGGVAWAVHRGISAVELRVDDGAWAPCTLAHAPSDDTWVQWSFAWDATPGEHTLTVRATDGDGVVQTDERRPVAPEGASGHHSVTIDVA
jgi:DMSO/TMAO reductase YedYZ molybdopterin-dependent catalytic subunit